MLQSLTDYHYINHAQRKYGNVPLWVLTNALTFGNISKVYAASAGYTGLKSAGIIHASMKVK